MFLLLRLLAPLHSSLGFWDTGLNPKLRLRRVEAAAVGIALAR